MESCRAVANVQLSQTADRAASRIQAAHRGNSTRSMVAEQKAAGSLPGQRKNDEGRFTNPLSEDFGPSAQTMDSDDTFGEPRPDGGLLPYCGVCCVPCIGLLAVNELGKIDEQWDGGELKAAKVRALGPTHTQSSSPHRHLLLGVHLSRFACGSRTPPSARTTSGSWR